MNDDNTNTCERCRFYTGNPNMTVCPLCNQSMIVKLKPTTSVAETRCPGCGQPPAEPTVTSVGFTWHLGCFTPAVAQPTPGLVAVGTPSSGPSVLWTPEPWRRW